MKSEACDLLDDYLASDLTEQSLVIFENHLPKCPECRNAVRFHKSLAERLRAAVAAETPPSRLFAKIRSQQATGRRHRWVAVAALAASVIGIAVALNWKPKTGDAPAEIAHAPIEPSAVHVAFRSDVLAVEVPVSEPGITAMWIYSAVNRTGTQTIEQKQLMERNGR